MRFSCAAALLCALIATASAAHLWPLPQNYTSNGNTYMIDVERFEFNATGYTSTTLDSAFTRYEGIVFSGTFRGKSSDSLYMGKHKSSSSSTSYTGSTSTPSGMIILCEVNVQTNNMSLGLDTDESYSLTVDSTKVTITAPTVFGAMYGLETFSQLTVADGMGGLIINETKITDFPRFAHRGTLIDTSRHYLPLPVILAHLDAMSYNKFNVLHWHIVDDESFPYVSSSWPRLSEFGAYNPVTQIYSKADVETVIQAAFDRGIRVIPEFDTPGHTLSWGDGYPELLTPCYTGSEPDGTYGPLNPIQNFTYDFVQTLFFELADLFIDDYMHIGGDEVSFTCWESNPDIISWMNNKGWQDNYALLENYYETKILDIAAQTDKDYIVWEEIFDNGLQVKPSTVVEVWKPGWQTTLAAVTAAGLRGILSTPWYLNYISYGSDWTTYYAIEPTDITGTNAQKELIVGGEACMWGEYVDGTNLLSRMWPRASAVGERLWSAIDVTELPSATERIHAQRCRMVDRNIPAEPPNGPSFCNPEYVPVYTPPWGNEFVEV